MSSFLAVPLKHTNEVDLVKPLMSYIENIYLSTSEINSEIKEAVQELNKMRNKACNQTLDRHQSALDALTRYVCSYSIKTFYRNVERELKKFAN